MSSSKAARPVPLPFQTGASSPLEAQASLREHGLKSTASRIAVLRLLQESATPRSHAEVALALEPLGFDRVTLYRNLIDMTNAGLLRKADYGDHVFRFELRDAKREHGGEHPHFVCTDCGTVSCLPEVRVEISAPPNTPNVARTDVVVQLQGICDRCH